MNIKQAIAKVVAAGDLTRQESFSVMTEILKGQATNAQISALVTALRMKEESVEEITGFAMAMREGAAKISFPEAGLTDTCGTGGDMKHTFNISTAAAFVASGAGTAIAKHGNRSVSSRCGSADVLQSLGVNISLGPEGAAECLLKAGICFLFAPVFHPAMKHAAEPRKEIGIRTIFNILGPLTNPAGADSQLVGVYDGRLAEKLARVLQNMGSKRAVVVHGMDGMDEISVSADTLMCILAEGEITAHVFNPEKYGIRRSFPEDIAGGGADENARLLNDVLGGEEGPRRDVCVVNAAGAIIASGIESEFPSALDRAKRSIDSGAAAEKLAILRRVSNEFGNS